MPATIGAQEAMSASYLVIDGYNVMHAAGLAPRQYSRGALASARARLIDWLAERLTPHERSRATIVFDARDDTVDRPTSVRQSGMSVRFAQSHPDADAFILELLERHQHPQSVTLVTADRSLARAARGLRARCCGSREFLVRLYRRRQPAQSDEQKAGTASRFNDELLRTLGPTVVLEDEPPPPAMPPASQRQVAPRGKKTGQRPKSARRRRRPRSGDDADKETTIQVNPEEFGDLSEFEVGLADSSLTQEQFDAWRQEIERERTE